MTRVIGVIKRRVSEEVSRGERLLVVLKRAANEPESVALLAQNPHEALREYHSLTAEERAALASGDLGKIEAWIGKLNKELANWLWYWLPQEKWELKGLKKNGKGGNKQ